MDGGLRDRFVIESVQEQVVAHLTTLGWFSMNTAHTPITVLYEFPSENDTVALNTLTFSTGGADSDYIEMGSLSFEKRVILFCDFYGENDAIARHLVGDIEHFLMKNPALNVYDYEDNKSVAFSVQVAEIVISRPVRVTQPWQKHWHTVSVGIEDELR